MAGEKMTAMEAEKTLKAVERPSTTSSRNTGYKNSRSNFFAS